MRLYRSLEKALLRAGQPRPPHRTPAEHADELAASGFAGADLVARITDRYVQARFGGEPLRPGEAASLRRELGALR